MTLTIAPQPTTQPDPEIPEDNNEVFDLLIFHKDGAVSLQTNKSVYYYDQAHFTAAVTLKRLILNDNPKLEYGIPLNMVDPTNPPDNKCLVNRELLEQALDADKIESRHPGVLKFFGFMKEIM